MTADTDKTKWLQTVVDSLKAEVGSDKQRALPPVHLWRPERSSDIEMEIRRDGSWWHEGGRINRDKLVRLFATILRKDEDGIYLVTPHEKVIVHVEDAPFIATRIEKVGEADEQTLLVTTNLGDVFAIDEDHPLRVVTDPDTNEPTPYVEVRAGLEARIGRAPFYDLVNWAEPIDGSDVIAVKSAGVRFELGSISG